MKRISRLLMMSGVAIGVVWAVGARGRMRDRGWSLGEVLHHDLRGFVTHRFDPLVMRFGLAGGRVSPWAILEHVGRNSGVTYRSPIYARMTDDHAFIPLPYGSDVHWVKNIQAAGHCRIQAHETILELDEPAVISASDNPLIPPSVREALERSDTKYLRLHVLDRAAGTFVRHQPEPAVESTTVPQPGLEWVHPVDQGPREPATA
jgi:deazaflavin-dependent oxidoreductase (nitroreductase family)